MHFTVKSNVDGLAAHLSGVPPRTIARVSRTTATFGQRLQTQVRAKASGRPGPRAQTGHYRRSINLRVRGGLNPRASVGTSAPQARRLEYGFNGTDRLGRTYNQPPLPHFRPGLEKVGPQYVAAVRRAVLDTLR